MATARRHSVQRVLWKSERADSRVDLHCEMCGLDAIIDTIDADCPYCAEAIQRFTAQLIEAGVAKEAAGKLALQGLWKQEQMRAYMADPNRLSALDAFTRRVEAADRARDTSQSPDDDYPNPQFSSAEEEREFIGRRTQVTPSVTLKVRPRWRRLFLLPSMAYGYRLTGMPWWVSVKLAWSAVMFQVPEDNT